MIAFVAGLQDAGHSLFETSNKLATSVTGQAHIFGVCCSSFFYYCAADSFNLSVQFTASHNPPEWVGCKGCDITAMLYQSQEFKAMITEYIDYPYL
jgi:phosphomannomutase